MTDPSRQEPRSLEHQLERIATAELLVDLESAYHQAARPGAESLLRRAAVLDLKTIPELDDPREMAALAAALYLRSVDLLEFWKPLLATCKSGQSTAPLRDLRATAREARALEARLATRKAGKARDAVLKKAAEAAERLEAWLPTSKKSAAIATKYARGAFDEDEDEDGVVKVRPLPDPKARTAKPESPLRTVLGWILTLAVVGAMAYGGWQIVQEQKPRPRDAAYFNALVIDVTDKRLEDDAVVFSMSARWLTKARPEREADIATLRDHIEREGVAALRLVDARGGDLATVDAQGSVTWRREKLNAGEMLSVGDVERDPIGEAAEPAPEGTLAKPMTAEELRRSSSP